MKEAEKWDSLDTFVDISDLTWEQKERVIRMLFAKLNGQPKKKRTTPSSPKALPPINSSASEPKSKEIIAYDNTFITQNVSEETKEQATV